MNLRKACITSLCNAVAAAGVLYTSTSASSAVIDFNNLPAGKTVGAQYFASDGLLIAAENAVATAPDTAITFNSELSGTVPSMQI